MKFKKSIFRTLLISGALIVPAVCTTTLACNLQNSTTATHSKPQSKDDPTPVDPKPITTDKFEIKDGVLYGFAPGVKPADLKEFNLLQIPNGTKKIEDFAFCCMFDTWSTIQGLKLNPELEEIGTAAFMDCFNIGRKGRIAINFEECVNLKKIGSDAFSGCFINNGNLLDLSKTKLESIGSNAFSSCECTKIIFPKTLTDVGYAAFASCPCVKEVDFSAYDGIPDWLLRAKLIFKDLGKEATRGNITVQVKNYTLEQWQETLSKQDVDFDEKTGYKITVPDDRIIWNKDQFTWDSSSNESYKITGFATGVDPSNFDIIRIPSKYGDKDVTAIADNAFSGKITTPMYIEFESPSALSSIGVNAFLNCTGLRGDFVAPATLTGFGSAAFRGCTNLGAIDLSNTSDLTNIEKQTFMDCPSINKIIFPTSINNTAITFQDQAFANDTGLSCLDFTNLGQKDVKLDAKTEKTEAEYAPFYNISTSGIILCKSDDMIFSATEALSKAKFPTAGKEVTSKWLFNIFQSEETQTWKITDFGSTGNWLIHGFTQDGYNALPEHQSVILPKSTVEIADNAFKNVFINQTGQYWILKLNFGVQKIGDYAFANGNNLAQVLTLPDSIKYIGAGAFLNCGLIRGNLSLPNNLVSIGAKAFANCVMIDNSILTIPNSVTEIGQYAFANTGIKSIALQTTDKIKLAHSCFTRMESLNVIDLTKVASTDKLDCCETSFKLTNTDGTVYVPSDADTWKTFLQAHGLPNSWTVKTKQ